MFYPKGIEVFLYFWDSLFLTHELPKFFLKIRAFMRRNNHNPLIYARHCFYGLSLTGGVYN